MISPPAFYLLIGCCVSSVTITAWVLGGRFSGCWRHLHLWADLPIRLTLITALWPLWLLAFAFLLSLRFYAAHMMSEDDRERLRVSDLPAESKEYLGL